jgi:hypothetical protein
MSKRGQKDIDIKMIEKKKKNPKFTFPKKV